MKSFINTESVLKSGLELNDAQNKVSIEFNVPD